MQVLQGIRWSSTTLANIDQHRMMLTLHVLIGSVIGLGDEAFHSDATLSTKPMWSANMEAMAARIWTTWELMTANLIQNEANIKRGEDDSFSLVSFFANHYIFCNPNVLVVFSGNEDFYANAHLTGHILKKWTSMLPLLKQVMPIN
ncbi:proline iminopeptidase [Iris pallida]|uniref:Proline iminopeptidase n=1 Tax=Iris pallida TaxID=29817 RepID=A0AAX6FQW8_IRIPA|nr:proline iminopeptidase [Iris pallida]